MTKHEPNFWRKLPPAIQGLVTAILIIIFVVVLVIAANKAALDNLWPTRLVGSIREYTIYPEMFTLDRVHRVYDNTIRFNIESATDYSVGGAFKLPPEDIKRFINTKSPMHCGQNCVVDKYEFDDEDNGLEISYYGTTKGEAGGDGINEFTLLVYPEKNLVKWYYQVTESGFTF